VSAPLERRYRASLDWYPSVWRESHGEAMLGTLLDEAEATGRERPALAQTINLLIFGLRERARTALPVSVRDRASALAWGLGAALSGVMFVATEWAPWATGDQYGLPWKTGGQYGLPLDAAFGPFTSAGAVVLGLWIAAFVVAVAGAGTVARWMLAATIPASVALVAFDSQSWAVLRPTSTGLLLLGLLALYAMQGSPTASRRGRAWMVVAVIGATGLVLPLVFRWASLDVLYDWWIPRMIWGEVVRPLPYLGVLAGVVLVAAVARRYVWAGAALLLCVPPALYTVTILAAYGEAVPILIGVVVVVMLGILVRRSGYRLVLQRRDSSA
jgi:hypothetical protein